MPKPDKKAKLSDAEKLKSLKKKMKKLKAEAAEKEAAGIGPRVEAVTKAVVAKTTKKEKLVSPLAPASFPDLPVIAGVEFAAGAAGVKYKGRTDVMLVKLAAGTSIAGAFTKSSTRAASILDCQAKLAGKQETGQGAAIIVNSGNANAFTGVNGQAAVDKVTGGVASALSIPRDRVFSSSTGVIGEPLPADRITAIIGDLSRGMDAAGVADAAQAIMTTDTFPKGAAASFAGEGGEIRIVGIAKGSGMIAPDMATMLVYIFTDAAIAPEMLQKLLNAQLAATFNAITVDSDTSTSDALILAATGKSAAAPITDLRSATARRFAKALGQVMLDLAHQVVKDGEGATKFVEVQVTGAASAGDAHRVAMAIANSPLVKTAIAGEDANWGRVVMAVGKSGAQADRDKLTIRFGDMVLAENGWRAPSYDEAAASAYMKRDHLVVGVDLGMGRGKRTVWTCDLTHGYIDINADYRS
ncbi:bifunctional glutamate N-acetyltransferase/amino-acid acetyltransferase ArgJ [Paracoccus shanxieyensis]|uniref:Arginine biosynthesis bifunctional protein ArgJ n=1 Tax=Paracoccus shanxieyensis TaxID=2675752 RepID=A0A6L6IT35_9RHOB|nr:bifunctional glutamate N-acetyltransferase/amino-acid acetyltransferase ArgJ [Paracoccus shanxieyensis]MTH63019.1 bifunctional glutamate N-acetyltransferase/amino-acid acetyltransferase ArgJ [Paracoccus shanxieyensis]MTH85897.1 bifunctional glutamate N-acetyltransferase/amino-acid acetyltransferase ArgJ [Paracoccus shanxieyensis]